MSNRPDERGVGVEPISKRLQERGARQWRENWGADIQELEDANARWRAELAERAMGKKP